MERWGYNDRDVGSLCGRVMTDWRVRVSAPKTVAANTTFEVKTLINHPMESGFRRGQVGEVIPRDILVRFQCALLSDGQRDVLLDAELFPGIAANPYFSFSTSIAASGELEFTWQDQHGRERRHTQPIAVE